MYNVHLYINMGINCVFEALEQSRPQVPAGCQRVCELPQAEAGAAPHLGGVTLCGWKLHFIIMDQILTHEIHLFESFSFSYFSSRDHAQGAAQHTFVGHHQVLQT